jgi:AcrR family transcriptional regulator
MVIGMKSATGPLSRTDWVIAALEALAEGGVATVKVDTLATRLSVSRGSFYWHFKARDDLLAAMLDFWENELTGALIARAAQSDDPASRLRSVVSEAVARHAHGLNIDQVEEALRLWARQDASAADRMRKVDTDRVDYVRCELRALGHPEGEALTRAKALYMALIGLSTARSYNAELADEAACRQLVEFVIAGRTSAG